MEKIAFENVCDRKCMAAARDIFRHKGIALAAAGSLACVRSLYLLAREMGQSDFLFWKSLKERDYSLGRNGRAIGACIQEALSYKEVKGVIVYASCMDILTGWDIDEVIAQTENPRHAPIEVPYRGPLAKRRNPPMRKLQEIWERWKPEVTDVPVRIACREMAALPQRPHFEEIIARYASSDFDMLLLTPGGCKSCIRFSKEPSCKIRNTCFTDVSLSSLTREKLVERILEEFLEDRPLVLIETMAVKAVGLDVEGLCGLLEGRGKKVKYFLS